MRTLVVALGLFTLIAGGCTSGEVTVATGEATVIVTTVPPSTSVAPRTHNNDLGP